MNAYPELKREDIQAAAGFAADSVAQSSGRNNLTIGQQMKLPSWVNEKVITGSKFEEQWGDLNTTYFKDLRKNGPWLFRGDKQTDFPESKMRKALEKWHDKENFVKIEANLVREFMRKSHHYLGSSPPPNDIIEWLSIMQHHGAPTRLIDWTYSFYVALFFALAEAEPEKDEFCVVWAMNSKWWQEQAKEQTAVKGQSSFQLSSKDSELLNHIFAEGKPSIWSRNPFRLNPRLTVQQGAFVAAVDLKKSFQENMESLVLVENKTQEEDIKKNFYAIKIPKDRVFLKGALYELDKMNINCSTLFPGLDGFARHMETLRHYIGEAGREILDMDNIFKVG